MTIFSDALSSREASGIVGIGGTAIPEFGLSRYHDNLQGNRLTAYAVTKMAPARKFYEGVLGLKVSRKFSNNFVEYDIGRGTLVVACAPDTWKPSRTGTTATLEVTDFDAALAHLKKKRIPAAVGPHDFPTCRMVAVRDPDGNMIALHQRKKIPKEKGKKKA